MQVVRVVIVEDEELYRDMLATVLAQHSEIEVAGSYRDGPSCLEDAPRVNPDVALLDIELPQGMNGVQVALKLREIMPEIGIVFLSYHRNPAFFMAMQQGRMTGWSYLNKKSVVNVDALRRAVTGVTAGLVVLDPDLVAAAQPQKDSLLSTLTPRQTEIFGLIAQGYTNAAIADRLDISVKTVENHINQLYQALGLVESSHFQPRVLAVLEYLAQSHFHPLDRLD